MLSRDWLRVLSFVFSLFWGGGGEGIFSPTCALPANPHNICMGVQHFDNPFTPNCHTFTKAPTDIFHYDFFSPPLCALSLHFYLFDALFDFHCIFQCYVLHWSNVIPWGEINMHLLLPMVTALVSPNFVLLLDKNLQPFTCGQNGTLNILFSVTISSFLHNATCKPPL